MRVKVGGLSAEISSISREQKSLFDAAREFEHTLATLKMKRQEAISKKSYLKELSHNMQFLGETDAQLHDMQRQYAERVQTYNDHIQAKKIEYDEVKTRLEQVRSKLGDKLTEEGRIEAEKKAYEGQLKERESMVREISIKHGMKGFDGELDDIQVQEFMAKISRMSRDQNLVLERIKRDNEDYTVSAQNDLSSLLSQRNSLQQKKEYAQSEIRSFDVKAKGLNRDLDSLKVDASQEIMVQDDLSKKERSLEVAKTEAQSVENDGSFHIEATNLQSLEEDIERVTEELYQGTRNADTRAQLTILKQNVEIRQKAFASLFV
jgi:DNA repair protein RAD50